MIIQSFAVMLQPFPRPDPVSCDTVKLEAEAGEDVDDTNRDECEDDDGGEEEDDDDEEWTSLNELESELLGDGLGLAPTSLRSSAITFTRPFARGRGADLVDLILSCPLSSESITR